MLQPFAVSEAVLETYRRYVRTGFPLRDEDLERQREALIEQGLLWAEPFISLARPGALGPKLATLKDVLDPRTLELPWGFQDLYDHQFRALERLRLRPGARPQSTLVLSGTGSGKTECFLIPIVDACLRAPGPGIKALIIYPMNALANDQLLRLQKLLADCPDVTFGRYTGDAPETDAGDERRPPRPATAPPNCRWSRQAMRDFPPNILLTNYTQLEYLLLRGKDAELFRHGAPTYLVVDEIHLFAGVLGAEVACLLRRLRQHVGAAPGEICSVGTSATAGADEQPRLLAFAERFFGTKFGEDAAIAEAPADPRPVGKRLTPAPRLSHEDLAAAHETAGLAVLAKKVLGVDIAQDEAFGMNLGRTIDEFQVVGTVERSLLSPAPIAAAADALGRLDGRAQASKDALVLEATAVLLLGAAARQAPTGEDEAQPRFRPRLHQVLRSLSGLWRCLNPGCEALTRPGQGKCPACGSAALPLSSCRTCGEAYWSSPTFSSPLERIDRLEAVDRRKGQPAVFLADPARLTPIAEDEEGGKHDWVKAAVCPTCASFSPNGEEIAHLRACTNPTGRAEVYASTDDVHCPSCGDQGARNRPILLPLQGSAAASVAVLTQSLSDELRKREGEAGGRLLVFADSRQDAGQQAGYADDQGARVSVRQLLVDALGAERLSMSEVIRRVHERVVSDKPTLKRWLIGEEDHRFAEVAKPAYVPSEADEEAIRRQLEWEIALDLTERSRRRFSPEQEGVLIVEVDRLAELVGALARNWPEQPFGNEERLSQVVRTVVEMLRWGRAVDHWLLKRTPREVMRNHNIRIGDRGVKDTRGYGPAKYKSAKAQVDIRGWTAERNATRLTELLGRVLEQPPVQTNQIAEALASRIAALGLLSESKLESRKRLMVDHKRLMLSRRDEQPLWRCDRCGTVLSTQLISLRGNSLCPNWRCPGTPQPYEPKAERDFYRQQYVSKPRRLIVREHSGQIEGDERLALEERFNDRENPTVDVLACTPTLEVGVSLDDLHSVILRNLPPTPANYAQRVGRAGRRSKVALALAHAGQAPHDSYFFERPAELIAGLVRAPSISLDNEPLLRRHVNSLVYEMLALDLPTRWVPPLEDPAGFAGPAVADSDGVLRETTLQPYADKLADPTTRSKIEAAVRGAFCSEHDPSPPKAAAEIAIDQVNQFLGDLRAALMRWCDRYRALLNEYQRLRDVRMPTKAEQEMERRLRTELERLAGQSNPEYQPLGFLGLVGFIPRYGFTGQSVFLHLPRAEQPIVQAAWIAVTEFAPCNIVYARGRKLKVRRLDPAPVLENDAGAEHRDNVVRPARRCDACEYLSFDPLEKSCPMCGADLVGQQILELTGVRGGGGAISSEDEYRSRADYHLTQFLAGTPRQSQQMMIGGFEIERTSGLEIIVANRGPSPEEDGQPGLGFEVCTGCGFTKESELPVPGEEDDGDEGEAEVVGHATRCPGRKDPTGEVIKSRIWLIAKIRGDVLEIKLPDAAREKSYAAWRLTLAESLKLGIRETMQAGQRDLASFERMREGKPWSIVIYDTMPGGTGYLPKLFESDAQGLKRAAAEVLSRLEACDCTASCYRCLRDFWNQRGHQLLNRFEVMGVLRRLAEGEATAAADPESEQLESFLEVEFFNRLRGAGLPTPTLQVVREIGGQRITRVDAEYRDPNVSVFLDGRAFHATTVEKIGSDLDKRNRLESRGVLVLEFTFGDVLRRFDEVGEAIRQALAGQQNDPSLDARGLPGLQVTEIDVARKRLVLQVDARRWIEDESERGASLSSANHLRLAGWRLKRETR
ncbi:MAG: hypothetical protein A2133_12145 [Actinobacteria bacterium RBG_16_64_13]|nr:MAG: hypothetical protein A2133_12145 [Actinobacteria bacterium RBG_16_64_13]